MTWKNRAMSKARWLWKIKRVNSRLRKKIVKLFFKYFSFTFEEPLGCVVAPGYTIISLQLSCYFRSADVHVRCVNFCDICEGFWCGVLLAAFSQSVSQLLIMCWKLLGLQLLFLLSTNLYAFFQTSQLVTIIFFLFMTFSTWNILSTQNQVIVLPMARRRHHFCSHFMCHYNLYYQKFVQTSPMLSHFKWRPAGQLKERRQFSTDVLYS